MFARLRFSGLSLVSGITSLVEEITMNIRFTSKRGRPGSVKNPVARILRDPHHAFQLRVKADQRLYRRRPKHPVRAWAEAMR